MAAAQFSTLFTDSSVSAPSVSLSSGCTSAPDCISYFYPGKMNQIAPPPKKTMASPNQDSWSVEKGHGVQVDYWTVPTSNNNVSESGCHTWGGNSSALTFCVGVSSTDRSEMIASKSLIQLSDNSLGILSTIDSGKVTMSSRHDVGSLESVVDTSCCLSIDRNNGIRVG